MDSPKIVMDSPKIVMDKLHLGGLYGKHRQGHIFPST